MWQECSVECEHVSVRLKVITGAKVTALRESSVS